MADLKEKKNCGPSLRSGHRPRQSPGTSRTALTTGLVRPSRGSVIRVPDPTETPSEVFITLDGVRFHYLDWGGDGEPMLMLAGLGCNAHLFAEMAPALGDGYRVIALTRRGHGLTDQVHTGHALADGAEDARRLLDALGIARAHLVGHSMGGGEISVLAAHHPERVVSVIYLDGAYDWADNPTREGSEESEAYPDRFASYDDYVDFVRSILPDGIWGPAVDAMLRDSVDTHADGSVVDKLSETAFAPFAEAVHSFRHPYSEITAPALAIYALGDQGETSDATWRTACRDRFTAETTHGRAVEISGSHYLFLDHRDDVLAAMREFLP